MHDAIPNIKKKDKTDDRPVRPRKANECFVGPERFYLPAKLFDEFWREGDLALLFGASGTGKSILATEIGESLARGRPIEGFHMPVGRRKVLYVDMGQTDWQFQSRYTHVSDDRLRMKTYRFSENFSRDQPKGDVELSKWLRDAIKDNGYQIVIIDDLSAIKNTYDGTRETIKLMRELKRVTIETGVSILVLACSEEPARNGLVSEIDLRRSRVLCSAASSVFAIGQAPRDPDKRYIIQTRCKSAPILWTTANAPICRITRADTGFIGFDFDERFAPRMDDETRELICRIKSMHGRDMTYREIAEELGISRSQVGRLLKKWNPAMNSGQCSVDSGQSGAVEVEETQEWKECGFKNPYPWLEKNSGHGSVVSGQSGSSGQGSVDGGQNGADQQSSPAPAMDVTKIPFAAAFTRRSVYDLRSGMDGYGREYFIEKQEEHSKRRMIWYQFHPTSGNLHKFVRKGYGIYMTHVGKTHYLPLDMSRRG